MILTKDIRDVIILLNQYLYGQGKIMKTTFISYSTHNKEIAFRIVEELEKRGLKCYIAPRDITPGKDYACEIVDAIKTQDMVTLIFTKESNISGYVLREINSAVLHNKTIIPYKIDDSVPSDAMEFYLGVTHWITAPDFKGGLDALIAAINNTSVQNTEESAVHYPGPIVLDYAEAKNIGYDAKKIVMETIEIDYLTLNNDFTINESIEGNVDSWLDHVSNYPELYSLLVKDDNIIGYWQFVLMNEENYNSILRGEKIVDADMLEFYDFGGEFYCYIAIMPILKEYENNKNMMLLWDKLFSRIEDMYDRGIAIKRIGISVYSHILEKVVQSLGFTCVAKNMADGKIYEADISQIKNHPYLQKKYPSLCSKLNGEKK